LFLLAAPASPAEDAPETFIVTGDARGLPEFRDAGSFESLSARDLDPAGIFDSRDLGGRVPGLVVSTNSAITQPYLRGVGSDLLSAGLESSVAVVVDEVYRSRAAGALIDLFDVDRIDVLRGPQGLHYGRNATGGVIHLRNRRPSEQAEASVDATYGSFELARLRFALNLPWDKGRGAIRLSGMHKQQDGYMRNVLQREGLEGEDLDALRIQAAYRPTDSVSLLIGADYSADEGTRGLTPRLAEPTSGSLAIASGNTLPDDRRRVLLDRAPQSRNRQWGGRIELGYHGDAFRVDSISAHRTSDLMERLDLDGTELPIITNDVDEHARSTTQEIRIASMPDEGLDWLIGGFAQHEETRQRLNPRFPTLGVTDRTTGRVTTNAFALFAQIGLALPADFRLSPGVRYSREHRELRFDEVLNAVEVADYQTDAGWDGWSPELTLEWAPRDDLRTYSKVSRGFKGGGFNTAVAQEAPIKPESLWAFEMGARAQQLGDRLRIHGSAFYYDYRDIQLQIIPPDGAVPFPVVDNAGQATLYGAEFGFELLAPGRVSIDGRIAWLGSELDRLDAVDVNQPMASPDQSGNRLPRAPELAFALGGQIDFDLDRIFRITPRIDYRYQSATYFDVFQDRFTRQNGYGVVNLQVEVETLDRRLALALQGYNLADERYVTNFIRVDGQFGNVSFVGSPRTFGITVRASF